MRTFMKFIYPLAFLPIIICINYSFTSTIKKTSDYPIKPVEFSKVNITDGFLKSRVDTVSKVTIFEEDFESPAAYQASWQAPSGWSLMKDQIDGRKTTRQIAGQRP